jgi:hypothetical protein
MALQTASGHEIQGKIPSTMQERTYHKKILLCIGNVRNVGLFDLPTVCGCQYEELHNLYSSASIIRMTKSRRMRWAGHIASHEGEDKIIQDFGGENQKESGH